MDAKPHTVDEDHPALIGEIKACTRPGSAPPPDGRSIDMLVNCYRVLLKDGGPREYFKYDVTAIQRQAPRPPRAAATVELGAAPVSDGTSEDGRHSAAPALEGTLQDLTASPPTPPPGNHDASGVDTTTASALAPAGAPPAPTPRKLPKQLMRVIVGELLIQHRALFGDARVVHDGMAGLYAPWRLTDVGDERVFTNVVLTPAGSGRFRGAFDVTVKLVQAIDAMALWEYAHTPRTSVNPAPVIQALDVVLRHLGSQRCISIGQNLFTSKNPIHVGSGKELHIGVHQSLRLGSPQLYLNVDTAATVFYAMVSLLELVMGIAHVRDKLDLVGCQDRWASAIRRLMVVATHRPKAPPQMICEVGQLGADRTLLLDRRGGVAAPTTRSVAQYFQDRYAIPLRYPELPVVNVGSRRFPEWLPMELCEVAPGQPCKDQQGVDVATILKQCKQSPAERQRSIQDAFNSAAFENDPFLQAFGIEVVKRMETIKARVLKTPALQVQDAVVDANRGGWDISRLKLYRPRRLVAWAVVNLSSLPQATVENCMRSLVREARHRGMEVPNDRPPIVSRQRGANGDVEALLRDAFDRAQRTGGGLHPDLIVVVKQHQDTEYLAIKRVSDSVLGVPSQCMLADKIARARGQYWGNVVLKVNQKLRGINVAIHRPLDLMSRQSTIVFGSDVDYSRMRPSEHPPIYAVVASMDASTASFVGRATPQVGLSGTLPMMLWELFAQYEKRTGSVPTAIVYFRDGTSDGLMDAVFQSEMKALRYAWLMYAPQKEIPPVTFVVVTRRHHVRAFPSSSRAHDRRGTTSAAAVAVDRNGNMPAGTVIDRGVVDPQRFEFFLYGHSGLLGTSRPTRYTVLRNGSRLREMDMEQLCFDLCHMFGRSTRSVSVVAPVYYAKILAQRGRCLLDYRAHDTASTDSDANSSGGGSASALLGEPVIPIHELVRNKLFFV